MFKQQVMKYLLVMKAVPKFNSYIYNQRVIKNKIHYSKANMIRPIKYGKKITREKMVIFDNGTCFLP